MTFKHQRCRSRRGAILVEFAVILPVILLVLVGLLEVGRMIQVKQSIMLAAREGGRQASTGKRSMAEVIQSVKDYMARSGYPTANIQVTVTNLTSASRPEPTEANQMDYFQITATMPFDDVRWVMLKWFTEGKILTGQVIWPSMRDIPLSINAVMPVD